MPAVLCVALAIGVAAATGVHVEAGTVSGPRLGSRAVVRRAAPGSPSLSVRGSVAH